MSKVRKLLLELLDNVSILVTQSTPEKLVCLNLDLFEV